MTWRLANLAELQRTHVRFLAVHREAVTSALELAGAAAQTSIARKPGFTPRTGGVQRATKTRVVRTAGRGQKLVILNAHRAARTLEGGSRAHIIRGKNGGLLRFQVKGGAWVSTREVQHPGTRPYYFMSRARDDAGRMIDRRMIVAMSGVSDRF